MKILELTGLDRLLNQIKNIFMSKTSFIDSTYPIGSIYFSTSNTNPQSIFNRGSWSLLDAGLILVGVDENDSDFNTSQLTGGSTTHTLITEELPKHNHGMVSLIGSVWNVAKQNSSTQMTAGGIFSLRRSSENQGYGTDTHTTGYDGFNCDASHTHATIGNNGAHNNVQPYITCYIWKRTA